MGSMQRYVGTCIHAIEFASFFGHVPILEGVSSGSKTAKKTFTGPYLEKYYPVSINKYARQVRTAWTGIGGNFLSFLELFNCEKAERKNHTIKMSSCICTYGNSQQLTCSSLESYVLLRFTIVGKRNKRSIDVSNLPSDAAKEKDHPKKDQEHEPEKRKDDVGIDYLPIIILVIIMLLTNCCVQWYDVS